MKREIEHHFTKGFTLLEVLVSIVIFAAIVSMIYPAYTGTVRNIDHVESRAEIYQMARITLDRMIEDLNSAYIPLKAKNSELDNRELENISFLGEDSLTDEGSADILRFNSRTPPVFDENNRGKNVRIEYYPEQQQGERRVFTLQAEALEFMPRTQESMKGLILCTKLHSMDIKYHDEKGEIFDIWNSSTDPFTNKLPSMVTISLEFVNPDDPMFPVKFMTAVSILWQGALMITRT